MHKMFVVCVTASLAGFSEGLSPGELINLLAFQ